MAHTKFDHEYNEIISPILNNDEFNKIKTIEHHGITRFEHSLKVSYYSYLIARILHLDYIEVARGGLLHDFFLSAENRDWKERMISTFIHPKKAVKKASEQFELSEKELDMIRTHMFPVNLAIPKYAESWVVNLVDKCIGGAEFVRKFKYRFVYAMNIYILFLLNYRR